MKPQLIRNSHKFSSISNNEFYWLETGIILRKNPGGKYDCMKYEPIKKNDFYCLKTGVFLRKMDTD